MSFRREPSKCPKCSERAFTVEESRTAGRLKTYLRRRRKLCKYCGYKTTTYEITADEYQEYLKTQMNKFERRNTFDINILNKFIK